MFLNRVSMGNATMGRITHDSSCGSFPVVGERRDRGASEIVRGRITWHSSGQFECTEGRRMVLAGMIPDGDRKWAFARSLIELEREFIGRLGKYYRDAHRRLASMLDWDETRGFDVKAADDPAVHATFGAFSFEGVCAATGEPSRMRTEALRGRRSPRRLRPRCAASMQPCLSRATMKFMAMDASTESSTPSADSLEALRNAAKRRATSSSAEWDGKRMAGSSMSIRAENGSGGSPGGWPPVWRETPRRYSWTGSSRMRRGHRGLRSLLYVKAPMMSRSVILLLPSDVGCPRGPLVVDLYQDGAASVFPVARLIR